VLCEPDSREPWFICEAHARDDNLARTLTAFERAVDRTMEKLEYEKPKSRAATA
jgi:glutamate-1-semialdehyde 2,1-aminomutase